MHVIHLFLNQNMHGIYISADVIMLSRDNMLDTIPTLYEEFDVSFELYIQKIFAWQSGKWQSVIRLTNTNNDQGNFGDRLAMVMVHGGLEKIWFISPGNEFPTLGYTHKTAVATEAWIPIRIQQVLVDGGFKLIFWYDGVSVKEFALDLPRVYNDTKIYAGDSFRISITGAIKDLKISTGKLSQTRTLFFSLTLPTTCFF